MKSWLINRIPYWIKAFDENKVSRKYRVGICFFIVGPHRGRIKLHLYDTKQPTEDDAPGFPTAAKEITAR